jgi:chemosensory pili system protein ChpA (sensor histidine kinase/response regulator)
MATILLVEDNESLRPLLARTLALKGHDVLQARDGVEALHLLAHHTPTLVVTDLNMPAVDGNSLVHTLGGYPRFAHIPVLLISGDPSAPMPDDYPFLGKPFSLQDFLTAVEQLVSEGDD